MTVSTELWKATYEAETQDELNDAYRQWACDYDRDTCKGMGYVAPQVAASMLDRRLDSAEKRVLDAGCGTGLVGEVLKQLGYTNIDAMDYSPEMICEARNKSVYRKVFQADMKKELDVPSNAYDATICVGTFTYAHVGPEAFTELVRITRPGGYICFTIREGAYQDYGYRKEMLALEAKKAWELQELRQEDYLTKEDVTARFYTYRVLAE